ncbi:hypothetical protein SRABI112_00343 [Pseudomonas mediterranea]|uniref:Uncharacterized protein n=1 Tax=Pseudomonas mediterranea TaxID=183795 RepID=A0AAX2D674_9PSED|nr:hypothetical protein SRABI112_00343 [Pseudomonas mediterranea]SDU12545.1 hypothetical protein SAMN05216476_0542 [Pseudomonas mediterranea]
MVDAKRKTIADSMGGVLLPFPLRREPVLSQPATGEPQRS